MGTTVQVEQGRWAYLDARLFVGGTAEPGLLAREVLIAYKKYGAFTFVQKPLNEAQTQLAAANADFGDITLQLDNSSIFPRTAGTLILDPAGWLLVLKLLISPPMILLLASSMCRVHHSNTRDACVPVRYCSSVLLCYLSPL